MFAHIGGLKEKRPHDDQERSHCFKEETRTGQKSNKTPLRPRLQAEEGKVFLDAQVHEQGKEVFPTHPQTWRRAGAGAAGARAVSIDLKLCN